MFARLEECYMVAILIKPAYTMNQLINKAYMAILQTRLYETPCAEYRGMDLVN